MNPIILFIAFALLFSCVQRKPGEQRTAEASLQQRIGGPCECCEGLYEGMPDFLRPETSLADEREPGERLYISGTVRHRDGKPASDVILYVYHTNAGGVYAPSEGQTGCARRHGRLRGWMQTNEAGAYGFQTIIPGSYPNSTEPRHIHVFVKEQNRNEYWIDSFVFDDDPFLTDEVRNRYQDRGGSGIVRLSQGSDESWSGTRDIILGEKVPEYR